MGNSITQVVRMLFDVSGHQTFVNMGNGLRATEAEAKRTFKTINDHIQRTIGNFNAQQNAVDSMVQSLRDMGRLRIPANVQNVAVTSWRQQFGNAAVQEAQGIRQMERNTIQATVNMATQVQNLQNQLHVLSRHGNIFQRVFNWPNARQVRQQLIDLDQQLRYHMELSSEFEREEAHRQLVAAGVLDPSGGGGGGGRRRRGPRDFLSGAFGQAPMGAAGQFRGNRRGGIGGYEEGMDRVLRGANSARFMQFQLISAFQDLAIVLQGGGGIERALLGASNNFGVLAAAAGGVGGVIATLGIVALPAIIKPIWDAIDVTGKWSEKLDKTTESIKKQYEQLAELKKLKEELAKAEKALLEEVKPEKQKKDEKAAAEAIQEAVAATPEIEKKIIEESKRRADIAMQTDEELLAKQAEVNKAALDEQNKRLIDFAGFDPASAWDQSLGRINIYDRARDFFTLNWGKMRDIATWQRKDSITGEKLPGLADEAFDRGIGSVVERLRKKEQTGPLTAAEKEFLEKVPQESKELLKQRDELRAMEESKRVALEKKAAEDIKAELAQGQVGVLPPEDQRRILTAAEEAIRVEQHEKNRQLALEDRVRKEDSRIKQQREELKQLKLTGNLSPDQLAFAQTIQGALDAQGQLIGGINNPVVKKLEELISVSQQNLEKLRTLADAAKNEEKRKPVVIGEGSAEVVRNRRMEVVPGDANQ